MSIMGIDICKASCFFRSRITAIWKLRLCDKLFVHHVISSVCDVTTRYAPDALRHAWIETKLLGISCIHTGTSLCSFIIFVFLSAYQRPSFCVELPSLPAALFARRWPSGAPATRIKRMRAIECMYCESSSRTASPHPASILY
jgi:hypothetical protein